MSMSISGRIVQDEELSTRVPSSFERDAVRAARDTRQEFRNEFEQRIDTEEMISTVKGKTKQSKRIPYWLWYIIAKSLGIRLHAKDKPILAWILHLLTLTSAGVMCFLRIWYSGYDIASLHTESDVMDGAVAIIMMVLYIGLGIYAHRLAFRLFVHPKFLELMRLHSKTIIKLNAAVLIQLLLTTFVIVQNIASVKFVYSESKNQTEITDNSTAIITINPCQTVQIPVMICQSMYLSQIVFSFFFLLWNAMIATILVSVARTHTIAIRRFICQLEIDAHLIDKKLRKHFFNSGSAEANDSLKHYLWLDVDELNDVLDSADEISSQQVSTEPTPSNSAGPKPRRSMNILTDDVEMEIEEESEPPVFNSDVKLKLKEESSSGESGGVRRRNPFNVLSQRTVFGKFRRLSEKLDNVDVDHDDDLEDDTTEPYIMHEEEILYKHWKLSAATRFTSSALQRWTSVATVIIVLWSAVRIVSWLSHKPSVCDVLDFIIPLLILPLLASTYAEVNFEGMKVLQSILPTVKRTSIFRYLYGMPIQMTVYGHPVTYGTMGTVFAAIVAALLSKILLQEMNKLIDA